MLGESGRGQVVGDLLTGWIGQGNGIVSERLRVFLVQIKCSE